MSRCAAAMCPEPIMKYHCVMRYHDEKDMKFHEVYLTFCRFHRPSMFDRAEEMFEK